MKTTLIYSFLAILVSSLPTRAITVVHLEDSVVRTWFSVSWGETPSAPLAFLQNGPLSDAGAIDNDTSVHVDAIHPFFMDGFEIDFAAGSRLFSTATVSGFAGVQILPLPSDPYGVQVVYVEPIPVNGVPEAGTTAGMLGMASIAFFLAHNRLRGNARSSFQDRLL